MPRVLIATIEGGDKGRFIAEFAEAAAKRFFSLGITNVQAECNKISKRYRESWLSEPQMALMNKYGVDITYGQGCSDLETHFELFEPDSIRIQTIDASHPTNSDVAATQQFYSGTKNSLLTIYLGPLKITNSTIMWRGSAIPFDFDCVIYHELLHACGDTPRLRGIVDGPIRHTLVCCEAINNLVLSR